MHSKPGSLSRSRDTFANSRMANFYLFLARGHKKLLNSLSFLANDMFTHVANTLTFIRFRRIVTPNISGNLTNELTVYPIDLKFCVVGHSNLNTLWNWKMYVMREAEI